MMVKLSSSGRSAAFSLFSIAFLAATAFLIYNNTYNVPFLFDDTGNILYNPTIQHFDSLKRVLLGRPGFGTSGRPLINLSLALNWAISGKNVQGYHLFNILVHICAGSVLFGILRLMLLSPGLAESFGRRAGPLALGAALLWIVHPINTAGVNYISQRAETLMGLFFLLCVYFSLHGLASPSGKFFHKAAVASFFLGAAAKEVIIVAPFFVLACDVLLYGKSVKGALKESRNLYLGLAAGIFALCAWVALGATASSNPLDVKVSHLTYALIEARVILFRYIRLSLWPTDLCFSYEGMSMRVRPADYLCGAVLLILLAATALGLWRRRPAGLFGVWFFGVLGPTSSIMPITIAAAEHRMYLPLAALTSLFVLSAYNLAKSAAVKFGLSTDVKRAVWAGGVVCLMVLTVVLGIATYNRNKTYSDEIKLWSDTDKKASSAESVGA